MAMTATVIDSYAYGPELLAYASQGLTDAQAQARPGPGDHRGHSCRSDLGEDGDGALV